MTGVFGNDAADVSVGFQFSLRTTEPRAGFVYRASLEAINAKAKTLGARIVYLMDNGLINRGSFEAIYPSPDICLVFLKAYLREAVDRGAYEADWNSTAVVEKVAARCPGRRTVVITHSAGQNIMPWATTPNVTAILAAHLPGQETGNSIVDVLWGDVNPSGRLPRNLTEGLMIDYRHFDSTNITPLYEFRYELSYTTFDVVGALSGSHVRDTIPERLPPAPTGVVPPGGNDALWKTVATVSATVQKSLPRAGATVLQLYLSFLNASVPTGTTVKVLRGFEKGLP
ncbi:uncharacterized protein BO97DRAFT_428563 [Aspergillus homomorphus CBS 101889]|uniref:beta-glucosidase n=1 Tax=Aspergillus homomorphus (strain CBS 101889) TaxID=1450537 RepID=A0A395HLA1_ASPHC|nr:hypothetical protein BO97DRAFT_428563 [Aspergillus homomorphus CBS 101889]RAL08259.1 hypothetical protein BO97DRAFT_428563 [Aspergillus homomorphus CBS 101889]